MAKIQLGRTYKDVITGFQGVATGYVQYITGCNQVLLAPRAEGGSAPDSHWYDEQRVEQVGTARIVLDPVANAQSPGCDKAAPVR